jgi:hypothetical protein
MKFFEQESPELSISRAEEEVLSRSLSIQDLQQTGLLIKIRFLLAMEFTALLPVGLLAAIFSLSPTLLLGRNAALILAGISALSTFVASAVALPVIRPIRRATRDITSATEAVETLATEADHIAHEQRTGTTILSGASKRLQVRRQSIMRDGLLIMQACEALQPRIIYLLKQAQDARDSSKAEILTTLHQGMRYIAQLSQGITHALSQDSTFEQLDRAMASAQEISDQFEDAGRQLKQKAEQLGQAANTLI